MTIFDDAVISLLPLIPKSLVKWVSDRYVAGPTLDDAIEVAKGLNAKGVMATIDMLGEHVKRRKEAEEAVESYKNVLARIEKEGINSNISLKSTHLGLEIDKEFCYGNIMEVVEEAEKYNNFVRIDMEDSNCTEGTLDIYKRILGGHKNVGVALQANLRRTAEDARELSTPEGNFRLCKGIYIEPQDVAFQAMPEVNENYKRILRIMFSGGAYVGIATHDDELINFAYRLIEEKGMNDDEYEFQMLLGVREKLREEIVSKGHKMRVYVPFGAEWYDYSVRRLKEHPQVARYALKEILKWEKFA